MNLYGDYLALNEIAEDAWNVAEESGWHKQPEPGNGHALSYYAAYYGPTKLLANLALIHSEVSEALEAVRKDPHHIGEELADVLIRTLELAHMLHINISIVTRDKMRANRARLDVLARAGGKVI